MRNPILTLRQLVQESALASSPEKRVRGIVSHVKSAMNVAVCSLYVVDQEGLLTLVATEGLKPESEGRIKLRIGEGLVGLIAKTQHPLNIESASEHPHFQFFPESGEERYQGLLGVPIVHAGTLTGVVVVEQRERHKFSEEEESFLVTVAAHIGALDPADFQVNPLEPKTIGARTDTHLEGVVAAPGVGIGYVVHLHADSDLLMVADSETTDPEGERARFREAIEATLADLLAGRQQLASSAPDEIVEIFTVYEMLLRGDDFCQAVESRIESGLSAASALRAVVVDYAARFDALDDEYFRARKEDIHILGGRVFNRLNQTTPRERPGSEKAVLVGHLVSIADIAEFPADRLAGIVSGEGSTLSHTALLAKALGVPAVMGVGHYGDLREGELVIVDGYRGVLLASPGLIVREEYEQLIRQERLLDQDLEKLKDEPATTPDGIRIRLFANTGLLADISPGLAHGAEGVGLYRTEIPFMLRDSFPTEDEQYDTYRYVLESYRSSPVYMRTLDVGGDKPLPYFPFEEENPALGWRGVRFTLSNSAVLMTQVRAMLRASEGLGNLRIMLPMVSRVDEVEAFSALFESAWSQLLEEGASVTKPMLGVMAEVPVITSILSSIAEKIEFVSIGSNDLSQYLLAVDRNNARVSALFDHLHPGVLQALEEIVVTARGLDLEVSVCGDLASDPCGAVLLLGMGVQTLSLPAPSIPRIKWLIRTVTQTQAKQQLELARSSASAEENRSRLQKFLDDVGLGTLIEPEVAQSR